MSYSYSHTVPISIILFFKTLKSWKGYETWRNSMKWYIQHTYCYVQHTNRYKPIQNDAKYCNSPWAHKAHIRCSPWPKCLKARHRVFLDKLLDSSSMECLSGSLHKQEYWTKLWQFQSRPSSNCHGRWRSFQISSHGVKHVFPREGDAAINVLVKHVSMDIKGNQSRTNIKSLIQVTWIYFSAKRAWVIQRKTCSSGRRWLLLQAGDPILIPSVWTFCHLHKWYNDTRCKVARCCKILAMQKWS